MKIIPTRWFAGRGHRSRFVFLCALAVSSSVVCTACVLSEGRRAQISVTITADGASQRLQVPEGSTVATVLDLAGLQPRDLDRSDPPSYVVLEDGDNIQLVRVEERFRTESKTIPFERQVIRNESLAEGEERLVQSGVIGEQELTYKDLFEDGTEKSSAVVKTTVLSEPVPEIVMVGARASFAPFAIPGRLAYISGGSAWVMEGSTANRRLIVNTGDLDGRVFALSPDGSYLLYTRRSTKPADTEINTLWAAKTALPDPNPAAAGDARNVHFASWDPASAASLVYSTVEPRATAPGWQANNDLYRVDLGGAPEQVLDAQSGGVYGWWGSSFEFSPSGRLAYSRPDGIGLVSQDGGYLAPIAEVAPLQTHGDWAWIPGITWGADSGAIFFVDHAPAPAPVTAEESPHFDLRAVAVDDRVSVPLVQDVGMFASPSVSPAHSGAVEQAYQVAFLQAIFPEESDVSRYRLDVMDRDGSDRREIFPAADLPGLDPQPIIWAPGPIAGQSGDYLCVIYKGNLWLVDTGNAQVRQITGDGLISAVDWK